MAGPSALSAVTLPEGLKAVRFRLVSLAPVAVLSAAVMLSLCQKEEDQRGTMSAKVLFLAGF